jgi:alkanesulfonate monooxygenase SsuD/methylene tetrahydromethanopterin reductase-like flavin-dependent oxidoreductase (luciferase family)
MSFSVGTTAWSWENLLHSDVLCAQAEAAEGMGFDSFWLPENHFGARSAIPAPLMLLAAIADRTHNLKLGSTSYLLPIRHPLIAAEEVAVLDQLCGGRLILGLGRGIAGEMFRAFGIAQSDKRKLFQSHLDIMRRAWRGEPVVESEGEQPVCLSPLPVQQPSPPLWVAAFGPLALQQVADLGLPYLASPIEAMTRLEQNYQTYHRRVKEAGLTPVKTVPVMRTVYITEDDAEAARVRSVLSRAIPTSIRHKSEVVEDWAIVGGRHFARDKLSEYSERLGLSHLIVRAGISGVSDEAQLRSHQNLLEVVSGL